MTDQTIQVGDVCLDLAQGRPVHVVEDTQKSANEWSAHNGYNLMENYGNIRLGVKKGDRVFEVVYCSNIKSGPSKTYAMPESRLARVETESADGGRPVADRVRVELLAEFWGEVYDRRDADSLDPDARINAVEMVVAAARQVGMAEESIELAREMAEAARITAPEDGEA